MNGALALTSHVRRGVLYSPELRMLAGERWLATWSDYGARIFDAAAEGPPVWEQEEGAFALVEVGPWVVLSTREVFTLRVLRADTLEEVAARPLSARLRYLAASSSGRLVGLDDAGVLHRVDLDADGAPRFTSTSLEAGFERAALAITEDGRTAAVAISMRNARSVPVTLFDLETMQATQALKGARATVIALSFAPGASSLFAATWSIVLAWALPKGKARTVLRCKSYPELIGCPDADHLLALDHKERAVCIDLRSDAEVWSHPNYGPAALDGGRLLHNRFEAVYLRDALTGALLHETQAPKYPRALALASTRAFICSSAGCFIHTWTLGAPALEPAAEGSGAVITACASSEDGRWLVLGTRDGAILCYDLIDGSSTPRLAASPAGIYDHSGCDSLALDPAHDHLWAGIGEHLVRYSLSTGAVEAVSEALKDDLSAIHPRWAEGVVLVTARARRRSYGAFVALDARTLEPLHTERLDETVYRISARPGGAARLFFGRHWRDLDLTSWALTSGDVIFPYAAGSVAVSPDSSSAFSLHRMRPEGAKDDQYSLQRWVVAPSPTPHPERQPCPSLLGVVVYTEDSRYLVTLHVDKTLRRWDAATGEPAGVFPLEVYRPASFALTHDGQRAVVWGMDGSCTLVTLEA